jgi:hypothetical protein
MEAAETLEVAAHSHILKQNSGGYQQAVQDMWKELWRKLQGVPNLRVLWKVRFHTWLGEGLGRSLGGVVPRLHGSRWSGDPRREEVPVNK